MYTHEKLISFFRKISLYGTSINPGYLQQESDFGIEIWQQKESDQYYSNNACQPPRFQKLSYVLLPVSFLFVTAMPAMQNIISFLNILIWNIFSAGEAAMPVPFTSQCLASQIPVATGAERIAGSSISRINFSCNESGYRINGIGIHSNIKC